MMMRILTASALSIGLVLPASEARADKDDKGDKGRRESLQLPIAGTAEGGVSFAGTLSITKFAAQKGPDGRDRVVAIVMVSGSATSAAGLPLGTALVGPLAVPVQVGPGATAVPGHQAAAQVQPQQTCEVLHLEVGAINLDLLGLQVTTLPIGIDLIAEGGGTDVLGTLICLVLELLGNVLGLVNLLNQILGLLTGLI